MDIYVFVVWMRWIAVVRIRIFRIMRIYRIGTMRCIVFTLTPVSGTGTGFGPLSSRERGFCRLFWLVVAQPCGYCLKASTSLRHGRSQ